MELSKLNIPDIRSRRIKNIKSELKETTKYKTFLENEISSFTKQLHFYKNLTKIEYLELANRYMRYYINSSSGEYNNYILTLPSDDRITTIDTWCKRHNLELLIDNIYYINFTNGVHIYGVRNENQINFLRILSQILFGFQEDIENSLHSDD